MFKSFDEFLEILDEKELRTLSEESRAYAANESEKLPPIEKAIDISNYSSNQFSIYLLKKYHEWLLEQLLLK